MPATAVNKRVPPSLTTFAPENTARKARRVGTLERYLPAEARFTNCMKRGGALRCIGKVPAVCVVTVRGVSGWS